MPYNSIYHKIINYDEETTELLIGALRFNLLFEWKKSKT